MRCILKKIGVMFWGILLLATVFCGTTFAMENYKWEELPKLPAYDFNLTNPLLLSTSDKIMSFGGINYYTKALYIYDLKTKKWADKSSKGFNMWSTSTGAVSNNKAYTFRGYQPNDMIIYDPSDDSKVVVPSEYIQSDAARGNEGIIFSVLGNNGDCEQLTSWTSYNNSSLSASTNDYIFGKQAIKITPTAEFGGMTMNVTEDVYSSKYYLATGYIRTNGTGTDGAKVSLIDADGNAIGGGTTNTYQKPTVWARVGYKIQPSDFDGKNLTSIKFGAISKDTDKTLTTLVDGMSLIEISAGDYGSLSVNQLMEKYPYRGNNINLLGENGDVDDISKWNKFASSYNTEVDAVIFGNRSVYSYYTGAASDYTGIYKSVSDKIDTTKYYFGSGYQYGGGGTYGVRMALLDADSNSIAASSYLPWTGYTRSGFKVQPSDFQGKNLTNISFAAQNRNANRNTAFYCDGLSLIEITQDEYNNLTETQLMAKYPFKSIDDTSRSSASLTTVNGKLYLIGGYFGSATTNDSQTKWGKGIWEFDTSTNTWTKASASLEIAGHMSFNVGGKIYIIGGRDSSGAVRNTRVLEWTPGTNDFVLKNTIPVAIDRDSDSRWHGVVVNGKIYLRNRSDTYVYNPTSDTWDWIEKQDYFNDGSKWQTIQSGISLSSNRLNATLATGAPTILYRENMQDVQITERVQMINNGTTVYLPFRSSSDGKNKYFVEVKGDTLRLCKTVNDIGYASAEELVSVTRDINTTIPHTYNIILLGDNIGIWEDYKMQIMIQDSTYKSGMIGFGTQDTQANMQFLHFLRINENSNLIGNELVTNGAFDTNIQGWLISNNDGNVKWLNSKLIISEQNLIGERNAAQEINIGQAKAVMLKFKANAYNLNTKGGLKYSWKNGDTVLTSLEYAAYVTQNNHKDIEMILTVPEGATTLEIQACIDGSGAKTGYIEFDDISVKEFTPQLTALVAANQDYVGLTSANGNIYQFKGYINISSDINFDYGNTIWNDPDGLPKGGYSPNEFGGYAISLSSDTNYWQKVDLIPNTKYKITCATKVGTLKRENVLPALKISFYDSQGMPISDKEIELKYDPVGSYGKVRVPFYEFVAPPGTAYAIITPELSDNSKELNEGEKWTLNPSFNTNTSYWGWWGNGVSFSASRDTSDFHTSPASLKLTKTGIGAPADYYAAIYCNPLNVGVQKGKWYKISFAAKASSPCTLKYLNIYDIKGGISYKSYFKPQNIYTGWRTYDVYFMPNQDSTIYTLYFYFSPEFDTINVDSFSLKEVSDIELLTNKSFDTDSFGWNYYGNTANGANAAVSRDTAEFDTAPASYKVVNVNSGSVETDMSVYSDSLPIENGFWYKLNFKAKSTQQFKIPTIKLTNPTDGSANYAKVALYNSPTITTDWQTYTVYFMAGSSTSGASIRFNLGGALPAGATLNIDSLSLQQTEDTITQITNQSFDSNADEWSSIINNGADVTVSRDTSEYNTAPGALKIHCTNKGTTADDIKAVSSEKLQIANYRTYKLTFKAKSNMDFTMPYVRLQKSTSPYTNYYYRSSGNLAVTNTWNTYTVYFRTNVAANDARLVFGLGYEMPNGADLYIDDISFQEIPFHWLGEILLYPATDFFVNNMELNAPKNTTVLDNYLVQGGKVIWAGNTPFENQGLADGTKTDWKNDLLETEPVDLNNNQTVSITQDGANAGITSTWQSKAPAPSDKVNTILAKITTNNAAAWEKNWSAVTPDKFMVRDWVVYGPLTTAEGEPINTDFIEEATVSPFAGMIQGNRIWNKYDYKGDSGDWIDFRELYGDGISKVAYANAYINSNTDQNLIMKLNTPNNVKLFVNGEMIPISNSMATISLKTGLNRILLKLEGSSSKWYVGVELEKPYQIQPIKNQQGGVSIDNQNNWIKNWVVLTGFTPTGTPIDNDYLGGETTINPTEGMVTAGKTWKNFTADYTGTTIYSYGADVSYAYTTIYSDVARKAVLAWTVDDQIKIWVNGVQVYRGGSTEIEVNLNQGNNSILVKVYNMGGPGYFRLIQRLYIMDWLTLSYFSPSGSDGMQTNYTGEDEAALNPTEGMVTAGKTWTKVTAAGNGKILDNIGMWVMDYAFAKVYCDTDRKAVLTTSLNYYTVIWVNGEYMGRVDYTTSVPINLKKGYNTILIKHYNGPTGWVRVLLTTTISATAEKPTGITVLGNSRIGNLIRLYDSSVDGTNVSVQQDVYSVLNKVDDNKIIYYDLNYNFTGLIKNKDAIASFFASKGFKQKNAEQLKEWMLNRLVTNTAPGTVVVFSQENAPDTIIDTQDANCLLRRYLNAGGKVIWTGEQPLANISTAAGNVELGEAGAEAILGITLKQTTESASVSLSNEAKNLGLASIGNWKSTRPINPGQGEIPLAVTASGDVSGWIRNYNPEYSYSGFIRLFDAPITISDTEKSNMLKLAMYNVNSAAVYYDARYGSDWISNSSALKTYLKGKGAAEINADNTDFIKANNYRWKTLLFSQDVVPDTMTRYNESISTNPCEVVVTWVDNSEGESAFVIYSNGVKKKTVYSDTSSGTGKSYMAVVEDLEANSTVTVKPAYIHYTEMASQRSEGEGISFFVKDAVSKKPGGLRGKTYPADENLRTTVDLSWEDTSTSETGFEVYVDGEPYQTVDSTTIDSMGKTYSLRFEGLESGKTYQFGVKNVYATQKSVMAVIDIQLPTKNIGTIRLSEAENLSTGWDKEARGYAVLEWDAVLGATAYGIYLYDGCEYRKVQEVTEPRWDSRQAKIYPSEADLNIYPDNGVPNTQNLFKQIGQGEDLRDVPTKLYEKTWGTEYDTKTEYYVKVSVINAAGEISYPDDKVTFQFDNLTDTTPPTGGIVINNEEGMTKNRVVSVSIVVTDTQSGLDTMEFSENASTWSPKYPYAPLTNWTLSNGTGSKTLYCRVTDKAGNSAVFSSSIELLPVDDIPSIRVIVNSGEYTVTSAAVTLTVLVSDDITTATSLNVRFSNNNVTWSNWTQCSTNQFPWILTSGNGRKTVYAEVKDENGNVGNAVVYLTLEPETSTSKVSIISKNVATVTTEEGTFPAVRGRIFEAGINVNQDTTEISVSWDGVSWSPWERATIISSGSGFVTVKKKLNFQGNEGWNELYVKSRGSTGTESEIISQKTLIDTRAPAVKLQSAYGSTATSSSSIDLLVEAEDNVSTKFFYSIGAGTKIKLSEERKVKVEGIQKGKLNLIQIRVYDEAGNSTLASIKIWGL